MGGRSGQSDLPWKTVPKGRNQVSQEGEKGRRQDPYIFVWEDVRWSRTSKS